MELSGFYFIFYVCAAAEITDRHSRRVEGTVANQSSLDDGRFEVGLCG